MHTGFLNYARFRYLWWSLAFVMACVALFVTQGPSQGQPANGGTWQGYTLGTFGALLIVWLSLLGIRKRSYRSTLGTVQGWTSAHVYLGGALLVVATLHCAAQFGLNVHTLAYVLMCLVIASGLLGVYFYSHMPSRMAANIAGRDQLSWVTELGEVDDEIRREAVRADTVTQMQVLSALEQTRLGGGAMALLAGSDTSTLQLEEGGRAVPNPEMAAVLTQLTAAATRAQRQREAEVLNTLLAQFGRRQAILRVLRRDARFKAWLKVWLYLHVPITVALIGALSTHVVTVFLYW